MSAPNETVKSPVPESPTTVRPLEMDDDDLQDGVGEDLKSPTITATATATTTATAAPSAQKPTSLPSPLPSSPVPSGAPASVSSVSSPSPSITGPSTTAADQAPPSKPPRPMSEAQKNELLLREAFPTVDLPVIKAVLTASGGNVDRAFHALLQMTDPDAANDDVAEEEVAPPPQPPRPSGLRKYMTQLESDELYARQLAEQYDNAGAYESRTHSQNPSARGQSLKPNEMYDRDHSFIDDDLPVIKENLRKGFLETQTKVNSWISTMKKKLDEALDEEDDHAGSSSQPQRFGGIAYGRRPGQARRSGDYERYDADPQVITDDFAGMKLAADGTPIRDAGSRQSPAATSNVFRPPPPQKSPVGRKVAFREEIDEIDAYNSSPPRARMSKDGFTGTPLTSPSALTTSGNGSGNGGANGSGSGLSSPAIKTSKWQPLSPSEMTPVTENDPFTLGDSDDERDTHNGRKDSVIKMEDKEENDAERLRKATTEAMADSLVDEPKKA
ncbi:hypothetical protein TD95_003540 [Thielaviopsis punctulata]|uniref:CUE domain-containing protein n=1 Tax=Thielaviopsis punctulata TaxID=72032 RepID=A0A0F4Z897_9PEZI|nr:hypothetical protein TD95_003540 [Thielaviopsis punctulata]